MIDLSSTSVVPSTPDPAVVSLVLTLLRYVVAFLTTFGFVKGPFSDTALGAGAYALTGVAMVIWAIVEKIQIARHTHNTAVVNAGRPIGSQPVQPA
jgi:hypothetical protein